MALLSPSLIEEILDVAQAYAKKEKARLDGLEAPAKTPSRAKSAAGAPKPAARRPR